MTQLTYGAANAARLDWQTRYSFSPEMAPALRRFAGVRPGMRIIELGCGTGPWGRLLAAGLRGRGSLLGIDISPGLVRVARAVARREGLAVARYRTGDATRLDLPSASADLVTCQRLLSIITDPVAVLREMVRVARPGGRVLANEPDVTGGLFWDPEDAELTALVQRRRAADVVVFRARHGSDLAIGSRLPELFADAGLEDIRLEGVFVPSWPLAFESRVPLDDVLASLRWRRGRLGRPDPLRLRRWLYRTGLWSPSDERAYVARARAALDRHLRDGARLRRWARLSLTPRVIVCGTVPRR